MHLNWERLSLSSYFEALEAHNAAHDPDNGSKLDSTTADRLARFNAAHGVK
jgi:hypothetical protein